LSLNLASCYGDKRLIEEGFYMTISYDVLPPFMKKESESLTFPKLSKNIDYGFISP